MVALTESRVKSNDAECVPLALELHRAVEEYVRVLQIEREG